MLVLEILAEINNNKIKNFGKFITVRGETCCSFDYENGNLIFRINNKYNEEAHTCGYLLNFINENHIKELDKVLIDDNNIIEPANACSMWTDDFLID